MKYLPKLLKMLLFVYRPLVLSWNDANLGGFPARHMLFSGFHGDMSCWKSNPNGWTWLKLASLPPKNKNMSSIAHPILGKGVLWNLFVFCLLYFKKTWNCHLATCKCKTNISLRQNMKDITRENIPILFFDLFWNSNGSSKRFREKSPWLVRHMSELHRRRFTSRGWSNWTNWSKRNINVRCKFFSPRWVMVSQEAVRN